MWYFDSPRIVFGEGALDAIDELQGRRALIVTDTTLVKLGLVERVAEHLGRAHIEYRVFDGVEPDPSVQTVLLGAQVADEYTPDWIIGLGGGSPMDAAKAIWVLYERPDLQPAEINPIIKLDLRKKARLLMIPTTSGTGSDISWGIVLTDTVEQRKMGIGNRENIADISIVDPALAASMPPQLTADTGLDVLSHAIECYTCAWHNDFADGPCLVAARLAFTYLPRAVANGSDLVARERMHNAATCAGLGFSNALVSIGHAMAHALGATFHLPHGRAVGLVLPYTIEFSAKHDPSRFADLARFTGCSEAMGEAAARALAERLRALCEALHSPRSLAEAGIDQAEFEAALDKLVDDAFNDTSMVSASRSPSYEELRRLFQHAYKGQPVDF